MLRWRLTLGTLFTALLAGFCWLDAQAPYPGTYLGAVALLLAWLSAGELLRLFRSRGLDPAGWAVYVGTVLPVLFSGAPMYLAAADHRSVGGIPFLALGLAVGLSVSFIGEMLRYQAPGHSIANVAASTLAVLYAGGCLGALVLLRVAPGASENHGPAGLMPLLTLVATVKLSDIGQYTFGRLFGRNKLAPRISPGKTWEGAIGGIATASIITAAAIAWMMKSGSQEFPPADFGLLLGFTLSISIAGLLGDLAESLLKRDAGVKDSSDWMPGFGGVLDLLDSLLLAAPVGCLWAASGVLAF
jgi:phosphatidate cytidylyltransferase